ncbi:MAG TPA: MBL fold metallo-hydrolase, partial [Candidatus Goldiibacteriota bacterium]|nr:MBL fold metallo-hydrolase [Candidatus Goldiibacteriota bacterium]
MKITPFRGAGEIGGNKFLLETANTKVFLDFGEPFDRYERFYRGISYLDKPRKFMGLRDYFEMEMAPKIPGMYSSAALKHTDLAYTAPAYDAVFISHLHGDHFGDVQWLDDKIPVYMGHGAKLLNDAYNECYVQFKSPDNGNVITFKTGDCIKIKDIEVIPVHVDHSTSGAYGFIIKTPEGNIAYTGDYRFHGFRPDMTEDFMKKAAETGIKLLMTEGTRLKGEDVAINQKRKLTEPQVEEELYNSLMASKGITVITFSPRNIDRARSLYNAAVKAGKVLVTSPRMAYIIDKSQPLISGMPQIQGNRNIVIFKKDGDKEPVYNRDGSERSDKTYAYEKPYLADQKDSKWVRSNMADVVFFIQEHEIAQLIDIKPKSGKF